MRYTRYSLSALLLFLLATACMPVYHDGYTNNWTYADLRSLDVADAVPPSADILAVYGRDLTLNTQPALLDRLFPYLQVDQRSQIRLDILDLPIHGEADIYLALDHTAGGTKELPLDAKAEVEWDTLIKLPATGSLQILDASGNPQPDLGLQVMRDPVMDTITLNLNAAALNQAASLGVKGQIFTTLAGSRIIQDQSSPFSTGDPPPGQAHVLFAFWNTFPAYTPAQTLRRWDGAHTGPLGGRHGLYNLLRTARNQAIPLFLLDLKTPTSLSALDYAEGLEFVRGMAAKGNLFVLDWLPSLPLAEEFQARLLAESRHIGQEFGLTVGNFIYAPISADLSGGYQVVFTPQIGNQQAIYAELTPVKPIRWKDRITIPIPSDLPNDQATLNGPSLELRRVLIQNALANAESSNNPQILILGGDLPQSTWGEPQRARATFAYLREHPWIKFMDTNALLTMQPEPGEPPSQQRAPLNPKESEIITGLMNAPEGQLSQAALDAYLALHAPFSSSSPELGALRDNYLGVVSMLLAAAEWETEPYAGVDCSRDLDMDDEPECSLASEKIFAIFEPGDASLVFAFARTEIGLHQVVGPTSQFVVGLSDPATWDLSAGLQADPTVIAGAFTDDRDPYQVIEGQDTLVFQHKEHLKKYHLTPSGIRFEYQTTTPSIWEIPLAFDPWKRFHPDWASDYLIKTSKNGFELSVGSGVKVEIEASSELSNHSFNVTQDRMGRQENPNYEYPPGHYLPFPMVLLELEPTDRGYLELKITD